jgi:hypothetical protein
VSPLGPSEQRDRQHIEISDCQDHLEDGLLSFLDFMPIFLSHWYGSMDDKLHLFLSLTFLELWWIAVWGIVYIFIEYMAKKSKAIELLLYVSMMAGVILVLVRNPGLVPKF